MASPFDYNTDPLDPEEQERERQAAVSALAATPKPPEPSGTPDPYDMDFTLTDRNDPVELSTPDKPYDPGSVDMSGIADRLYQLDEQPGVQDPKAIPKPDEERVAQAAKALAETTMNEPGTEAPKKPDMVGQAAAALAATPPPQAASPAKEKPQGVPDQVDPLDALRARGDEEKRKAIEMLGEEPSVNGWALLADVAFNKGHGIPNLLSQVDADKRAYRQHVAQAALGKGASGDPVSQYLAMDRIKATREREERLNETAAEKKARLEAQDAASAASRESMIKMLENNGVPPEELDIYRNLTDKGWNAALPTIRHKLNLSEPMVKAEGHAAEVKAAGRARGGVLGEGEVSDVKAETARKVRRGQVQEEMALLPDKPMTPQQAQELERQKARDAATDENNRLNREHQLRLEAEAKATRSAAHRQTFMKSVEKAAPVAFEIQRAEDLIAAYEKEGKTVPGIGITGHDNPIVESGYTPQLVRDAAVYIGGASGDDDIKLGALAATQVRGVLSNFQDDLIHNRSGAAFSATEEQRNAINAGTRPGAPIEAVKIALKTMHDIVQSKIGGFASVSPNEAHDVMQGMGLRPDNWGSAQWNPKAQVQQLSAPAGAGSEGLAPGQSVVRGDSGEAVIDYPERNADAAAAAAASPYVDGSEDPNQDAFHPPKSSRHPMKPANLSAGDLGVAPAPMPTSSPEKTKALIEDRGKTFSVMVKVGGNWRPKNLTQAQIADIEARGVEVRMQ